MSKNVIFFNFSFCYSSMPLQGTCLWCSDSSQRTIQICSSRFSGWCFLDPGTSGFSSHRRLCSICLVSWLDFSQKNLQGNADLHSEFVNHSHKIGWKYTYASHYQYTKDINPKPHLLIVFKNHIPFIQSINIQWTPAVSGHCNLSLLLKESNGTLFSGLKAAISTCQFMLECWCQFQGNLFHIGGKKEGHDKEGNGGRCSAPTKHQAKNSAAVWCSLM